MSAIDEIIARSRTPGTFVERRHFTLSREKAIEKLREFSLRHPQQYVLELIQAAVFSGATYIAVDISATRLLVAWVGGRPYESSELGSIFDYLFADRGELSTRHLTQLAIGLNALLQRKPRLIRIESGDGTPSSTARMDLDHQGEGQLGIPESSLAGTYLLVEYPSRWLAAFGGRQFFPEEGLIETRCLYVPVPVLLNGRAPFGYRASREIHLYGIDHQRRFDDGVRRGVIGLPGQELGRAGRTNREFRMIVGGVWISTLELPELGGPPQGDGGYGPLSGVICDDRLRKTADQSDIVQDRRFVELLHAIQPLATELIREHSRKSYVPPALPHIPSADPASEVEPAEPLPEVIPQVGLRPVLSLAVLRALPTGEPIFWVRPDDADDIADAIDPQRFGHHVLKLTAGQARSLSLELPEASLTPLNNAADADFVRRMLERRQATRIHTLPFSVPGRPEVSGRLVLRFHAAGNPPRWGDPQEGDTPVLIAQGEETLWTRREPLGLPRVSAVLELEEPISDPQTLQREIADRVAQEAWNLLRAERSEGDAPPDPLAEADLLIGIFALNIHPCFVAETGQPLHLDVLLPPGLEAHAQAHRQAPLARTAEGQTLSLADLIALQGQPQGERLALPADRLRLEPLEARLGFGHLLLPDDDARPILALRLLEGQWRRILPNRPTPPGPTLWLKPSFTPGFGPHPAIGQHTPSDHDTPDTLWAQGQTALQDALRSIEDKNQWSLLARASGHSLPRCQGMGRLALLALSLQDGGTGRALRTSDERLVAPLDLRADLAPFRIAPLHGPSTLEADTLPLTFDQLQLLLASRHPLHLQLDDAPDVWRSLADTVDPRWLVRQEVHAPGIQGWLGLRIPFDPTAGILLQSVGTIAAMPHPPTRAPCHGRLWLSGGSVQLSRAQLELLTLARRQLYQRLDDTLDLLDGEPLDAARLHLRAFAAERSPPHRTAAAAPQTSPDTPEDSRPLLHLRERLLAALPPTLQEGLYLSLADDPRPRKHAPLRTVVDDVRGGLSFLLNDAHPLADAALRNPRSPAAELLLLEMARRISVWSQTLPSPADYLEVQRVLIAQRVSQTATPSPLPSPIAVPTTSSSSR